ncbi:hypothetical protein BVRB_4g091920 [Beta vulgaris subsp. vulgaris]|nr:hypothetical protein BVRB_4g091920 [Beta vulgaris subsp. vulgaris]
MYSGFACVAVVMIGLYLCSCGNDWIVESFCKLWRIVELNVAG